MEHSKPNRGARGGWPLTVPRKLIAGLVLAGAVALPGLTQAQDSCGGSLTNAFVAPTPAVPRFVGDTLRVKSTITNTTVDFPWTVSVFKHQLDCANAGNFFSCIDSGAVINFVGNVTTSCVDGSSNPVTWAPVAAANLVTFTPNNPVVLAAAGGAGAACDVSFDVQIASLDTDLTPYLITSANGTEGLCGTLPGSAQGSLATAVSTCGLTLKKEVSTNGGGTWADANAQGAAPQAIIPPDGTGNALYRLTATNTGTAPFLSLLVKDTALGIDPAVNVGALAAGATKVITSGDLSKLDAIGRCVTNGYLENVSNADGICRAGDPGVKASALDNAWVQCIGTPKIDIVKKISVDGVGGPYVDANDAGSAPTVVWPHDAWYQLVVTNTGTVDLKNVEVTDSTLGIAGAVVGNLAQGASVILAEGQIAALFAQGRCTNSGTFTNTASTSGASVETDQVVNDSDPAVLKCVGRPHISLRKQISVDGGSTWADADAVGAPDVPSVAFPHGAMYRLIVKNDGTTPLDNVTVADPDLGIASTPIANLAVGQEVIIGSGAIPALTVATRCNSYGDFINTASVSGTSTETGEVVQASNPAVLHCTGTPNIQIVKEISINGGSTWFDANTVGTAPTAVYPHDALYRLTVTNIGNVPLTNVVVNDATLGIVNYPVGGMAPGAIVVLNQAQIAALFVRDRCTHSGEFGNTASTSGRSAETGAPVNDSDPAYLVCTGDPAIDIRKEISIDSGATWHDANDAGSAPVATVPSGAWYRFIVKNVGNVPLTSVTVADAELGIPPTPIGPLAVLQEVTIGSGIIAQLNVATRCESAGTFTNVARADGISADGIVTDSDPAVLVCEADDLCLTRTPGFWGTHPHVTVQYLDIRVCGKLINTTVAGTNHSSAEAMCMSGVDAKKAPTNMHYLQLVRQLTAAKLNVAASATDGGTCDSVGGVNIDRLIARCEASLLCGDTGAKAGKLIAASGCIEQLDAFNNSEDTLDVFGPFVTPGPADPTQCQIANGNGVIVK